MGVLQEHTKKQNKSKIYLKIGRKVKKGHTKYITLREDREIKSRDLHQQTNIELKSLFVWIDRLPFLPSHFFCIALDTY